MIAVQIEGRLGNQLFQYAFIYAAAKKLKTSFYVDKSFQQYLIPQYFEVKKDRWHFFDENIFSIKGYKHFFHLYLKRGFYILVNQIYLRKNTISFSNNQPAEAAIAGLKDKTLYKGFFYSQSYFNQSVNDIRHLYKIKKQYIDRFEQIAKPLFTTEKRVVVHVRRGDYIDQDIALPISYYHRAIAETNGQDTGFIFISDDPAFVEENFGYLANKYISTNDDIIDLQFLMNAQVCILSPSSFSWWGAWLNQRPDKQVIAPEYWLGFKEKKDYPMGFADHLHFKMLTV